MLNHITHLPTATLSTDQSNRSPGFWNFQLRLRLSLDSEDGFRTAWLSKRQSLTTVLLRAPITQMIFFNQSFKHCQTASNKVAKRTNLWLPNTSRLTRAWGIWFLTFACPRYFSIGRLRWLIQRKRYFQKKKKNFAVVGVVTLIAWHEWFSCKSREWKSVVNASRCRKTSNMKIPRCPLAKYLKKLHQRASLSLSLSHAPGDGH